MKVLVVFGSVLALVLAAAQGAQSALGGGDSVFKKEFMAIRSKCAADLQASADDLKALDQDHDVTSDFAKKMMLCTFRAHNIIDDDNKYSKKGFLDMARRYLEKNPEAEEKLKVLQGIADACESEIVSPVGPSDGMAVAKEVFDCLTKKIIEKSSPGYRYGI